MNNPLKNRVAVITGGYGCGKTEITINLAVRQKKLAPEKSLAIIDLDIINPFFRTRDHGRELSSLGIELIAPAGELSTADLPALPAGITSVLHDESTSVLIDLGGDVPGARAIGRYSKDLHLHPIDVLFIINTFRPYTRTCSDIMELIRQIESVSRLKVTALANNNNLLWETKASDILASHSVVQRVAKNLNIPIAFVSCKEHLYAETRQLLPNESLFVLNQNSIVRG